MLTQSQMQLSEHGAECLGFHQPEHFTPSFRHTPEKHPPNSASNTAGQ